jgi:hypothetical protein
MGIIPLPVYDMVSQMPLKEIPEAKKCSLPPTCSHYHTTFDTHSVATNGRLPIDTRNIQDLMTPHEACSLELTKRIKPDFGPHTVAGLGSSITHGEGVSYSHQPQKKTRTRASPSQDLFVAPYTRPWWTPPPKNQKHHIYYHSHVTI